MAYRMGTWYESKGKVRADYGEYRKGILLKGKRTAVIFNYQGARRVHYGDYFDPSSGTIRYVGEGKAGDQKLNARNQRLHDLVGSSVGIDLFLDCGDIFKPKRLLFGGKWLVNKAEYKNVNGRKVYIFTLSPKAAKTIEFLQFTFFDTHHQEFENSLEQFAKLRHDMYSNFPDVLRVRDNIIGEIGEYFAVKALNKSEKNPVIRLSSGIKNVDAVQIKNGRTYAVKTIGRLPATTSNIWASSPEEAVDDFIIVLIDHGLLKPICVMRMSAKRASKFLRNDQYQGSKKLLVNEDFANKADLLSGKIPI